VVVGEGSSTVVAASPIITSAAPVAVPPAEASPAPAAAPLAEKKKTGRKPRAKASEPWTVQIWKRQ
jgi:hypothetical protein